MPTIKPFYGIRPNPAYAGEVVLDLENLSLQEAKVIRQGNPYSYVNMLVPKLDNLFLRGSKNELAFKKINENFEEFLDKGILIQDPKPSVYVYRVSKGSAAQTGVWTVTSIDDYITNRIRKHELTRPERETVLIDYLQQTGIDANPVLITYPAVVAINLEIHEICQSKPDLSFQKNGSLHELWKTDDRKRVKTLVSEFASIPFAYIADGHHRAAAASLLALEQRKLNPKFDGSEEFNFFTAVYMASNQLKIFPFHRLVKDLNGKSTEEFINDLQKCFSLQVSGEVVIPMELHEFGMYLDDTWYRINALPGTFNADSPLDSLDVSLLQDRVFTEILNIPDPRTDPRISFFGGNVPPVEIIEKVNRGEFIAAFTLYPTSIEQLIKVADTGAVMPPKSTWFEPKFQAGLLTHKIN